MPAGIARPDPWTGIALNADPNDTNTPRVWTPLESSRLQLWSVSEQVRGRDYELAQAMSSSPSLVIRDVNEDLNPANPSSPYAGDVECYREVCQLAQYPVVPVGGAVNLINSGTWRGSGVDAYDPTFESYTAGASAPNWLERTMIATPTITTTNPQQGTQCATFNILGSVGPGQGVRVGAPVIPGRQYTSSAYVRQTAANSLGIFVEGVTAVYDSAARTVASGLGTPNASWLGASYSTAGGSASDYNVSGGQLKLTLASASTLRIGQLGSFYDSEQTVTVTAPALATGDSYVEGLVSRYIDASNYYRAFIEFRTDGSLGLIIERRLAAVNTWIADVSLPLAYAVGDQFVLHFSTYGGQLNAWCWPVAIGETQVFTTGTILDSSAALQASGGIGIMAYRFAANTNSSPVAAFEAYGATGSVAGTSTTTTGAYVRLAVTYTADQIGRPAAVDSVPYNLNQGRGICVRVHVTGTVSDGTVNIDAIQHEQGAAASAFNASGPVVYPVLRLNMERYPRGWLHRGYEGVMTAPCVDALAQLNKIDIPSEYDMAVMAMAPDLYYALDGSGTNAAAADSGGRGGPALLATQSSLGSTGTAYSGGANLNIPGAPGAGGTTFTAGALATPTTFQQGTVMAAGYATPNPAPLAFPLVSGGAWAITIAAWVQLDASQIATSPAIVSICRYQSDTLQYRPIQMTSSGVSMRNGLASGSQNFDSSPLDGQPHFLLVQIVQDATNTVFRTRIDFTESETTSSTATFGFFPAGRADTISVGGVWYTLGAKILQGVSGAISKVAVWNRELTSGERDELWSAGGQLAMQAAGEPAMTRILRHIQQGAYRGPTRIGNKSTSGSSALLGPPTYAGTIDLLTDSLNNAQADLGVLWVQADGVIAAEGKLDRWLRLTSTLTLGENVAGGEYAYDEQPLLSHDPRYVFPVAVWKRNNGATAQGGLPPDRQAAVRKFFPRRFEASSDFWADDQAQDASDWVFYSHRNTLLRTESVVLDPWSYTGPASLWPVVLSLEPGRRITLVRRAKSANNGAGLVISKDFFVEKVVQPGISFREGQESWTFELQLSPAGAVADPGGAVSQPWILGDSTWSVLGSTTVLGW